MQEGVSIEVAKPGGKQDPSPPKKGEVYKERYTFEKKNKLQIFIYKFTIAKLQC